MSDDLALPSVAGEEQGPDGVRALRRSIIYWDGFLGGYVRIPVRTIQSANAGKPQPVPDPSAERQQQKEN